MSSRYNPRSEAKALAFVATNLWEQRDPAAIAAALLAIHHDLNPIADILEKLGESTDLVRRLVEVLEAPALSSDDA